MKINRFSALSLLLLMGLILFPLLAQAKTRAFLGVNCIEIQPDAIVRLNLADSQGVLIDSVVESSPADKFGLKTDDIILKMDKTKITKLDDFIKAMSSYKAGKQAKLSILRNGKTQEVSVVFGAASKQLEPKNLSFDEDKKTRIRQLLDYVNTHEASMGSLAIAKGKNILYSQAIGYKQIGLTESIPADPNTKYRIGSISKTFTSVMIHQLFEENKLSPDTKLAQFFPRVPNSAKITMRMMLTHRSGIGSFTDAKDYLGWNLAPRSQEELIGKILEQKPAFKPGKKNSYSNSNYLLLGYIIEAIDKTTYPQALNKRITQKIGLSNTYYGGKIDVAKNEALSYYNTGEWIVNPETDMSVPGGAGAIVSTASDLVTFIEALFKGELISMQSLAQMLKEKDGMGSGIYKMNIGVNTYYGHNGRIDSFNSMMIYSPKDEFALAYLENGKADAKLSIIALVAGILSEQHVNLPRYKETFQNPDLDTYPGTYINADLPMKITVMNTGNELYMQAEGQEKVKVQAISPDSFQCPALDLTIIFSQDRKFFTLYQGGQTLVFNRVD